MFDIRRVDLGKLNSLTKSPLILTYHTLGDKGVLQDKVQIPFTGRVIGTEKVDGTNTRLIFCPDGSALVGSREDLLWERRDLIGNPAMGIVEAVKDTVQRLFETLCGPERIAVYFLEVYGRHIGSGAKNYTRDGKVGFRLFDVVVIDNFEEVLAWPAEQIAHWRDNGGQNYVDADRLVGLAKDGGFEPVPALFDLDAAHLPTSLEDTQRFLLDFERSRCTLDEGADGVPEGVVVRSPDRKSIAKIRREDYERTLKRRKKQPKEQVRS
ncbi:MAG: RNA ligase family protein [Gemmataceae bacterium]|nr:RNA ligase family protein [Gemmataceae bacterium]